MEILSSANCFYAYCIIKILNGSLLQEIKQTDAQGIRSISCIDDKMNVEYDKNMVNLDFGFTFIIISCKMG